MEALFDDRYIAENYYRGFQDGDGILHEKDGTISKLMQFDYKVHKLMKDPKSKVEQHDAVKAKQTARKRAQDKARPETGQHPEVEISV